MRMLMMHNADRITFYHSTINIADAKGEFWRFSNKDIISVDYTVDRIVVIVSGAITDHQFTQVL